tara:strand:+ start:654 stop:1031 length:378 start_codon:yes stop_codon:yes gene_type:complete
MQITLTFNEQLNSSLQIGDTVWYLSTSQAGGYDTAQSSLDSVTPAKRLGTVEKIINQNENNQIIISNYVLDESPELSDVFVMFSKDSRANTSSVVGYYAEVSLENNSKDKIELFSVGSEIAQSSK